MLRVSAGGEERPTGTRRLLRAGALARRRKKGHEGHHSGEEEQAGSPCAFCLLCPSASSFCESLTSALEAEPNREQGSEPNRGDAGVRRSLQGNGTG